MATAAHRALNVGDIQSNERSSGSTWCDAGTGTLFIIIKSKNLFIFILIKNKIDSF